MGGNEAHLDRARQLTIEQKAALCLGGDIWHTAAIPEHGIGAITLSDGPHGLRRQPEGGDHVGIGGSLPGHLLPDRVRAGLVLEPRAGPGDRRRARRARPGRRTSRWCSGRGSTSSAPRCAAATSSTCPRTRTWPAGWARRWCTGIQAHGVGTCSKHFAVNNQETDRMRVSADVDERTLREIYLPAFEHIVTDGRPVDRDVRLQQDQRHVRVGAPLAAHRAAARRVGLRRAGHVRLGRRARPGRRGGRRARPGDAARPRAQRQGAGRGGARGPAGRGRARPGRGAGAAAGRPGRRPRNAAEIDVDAHHALARRAAGRVRRAAAQRRRGAAAGRQPAPSRCSASSPAPRATRAPAARR